MEVKTSLPLDLQLYPKGELTIKAINHPLRQRILSLIHERVQVTVTMLYTKLDLDQSATSQHLARLRAVGLVNTKKLGKEVYYSVNYERLEELNLLIAQMVKKEQ